MNIVIRINVYVLINLFKKNSPNYKILSHLKPTSKKLSICTSDNKRLFKSIANISCCCKRLSS